VDFLTFLAPTQKMSKHRKHTSKEKAMDKVVERERETAYKGTVALVLLRHERERDHFCDLYFFAKAQRQSGEMLGKIHFLYPWYGGGNDFEYLGGLVSYYCQIWSGRLARKRS